MGLKKLFTGLFGAMMMSGISSKRHRALGNMNLAAPQRYGRPVRGWRRQQSVTRHREIQRRQRRNS
jgi:hypothetical protein